MCFSVLVKCFSVGFFSSSHGLRQRDPLSPLLFVIVMEALGRMILVAMSEGSLFGFFVGTRTDISIDDTLLFCGVNPKSSLQFTKLILMF